MTTMQTIPELLDEVEARLLGDDGLSRADRDALATKLNLAHAAMANIVDAARGACSCTVRHGTLREALRDWPHQGLRGIEPSALPTGSADK